MFYKVNLFSLRGFYHALLNQACILAKAIHYHHLLFLQINRMEFWTEISSFFNSLLAVFMICELLKAINESFLFPLSLSPLADIDSKKESLNIRKQRLRTRSVFFITKLCVLCAYSVLCGANHGNPNLEVTC